MKTTSSHFVALALPILLQGCVSLEGAEWRRVHEQTCRMDEQWPVRDTLHFGRSISTDGVTRLVGDDEWQRFGNEALVIDFPGGCTVTNPVHRLGTPADGVVSVA